YELRRALTRREGDFERLRDAMEILAAVNEPNRFMAAAMALCNETASRWNADRVSLGFLKGRYVRLRAMSRTEKFSRKMKLVQDIEAAMEECLDQDAEVVHPAAPESTVVSRAAAELARRHGPSAIVSLPLRADGEPVAVLTVERAADQPFDVAEVEALRLTCELCTPRVLDLHRHDKWFGAKAAGAVRKGLAALVGPKHTWAKIAAILVLGVAAFLVFAKGDYTVDAPFTLEPIERRVAPAPFQGYIKEVFVEPDDTVEKGQTLATLETKELLDQLTRAMAKRTTHLKEKDLAIRENKRAEANIALERVKEVEAEIRLLRHKIEQATIVAPISGKIITGDLAEQIGKPVETGEVLFEIAPLESLRAELHVPEDDIAEIELGQTGRLATETYPGRRLRFEVTRISPVAEVVKQKNVFKVRAELVRSPPWMRPGMQGVAKIHIGRRRYAWIWTHDVIDWFRMKLWL
ncbi:MAG: HlyD family efflux transporter periplasmic adaptor subunit, partial [bacterium]